MAEQTVIPWGIHTIGSVYHPDVQAGLPDGRWVAATSEPYASNFIERLRAAWWVLSGRAHAFIYPEAGDLEAIWDRSKPTMRPWPLPFSSQSRAPESDAQLVGGEQS